MGVGAADSPMLTTSTAAGSAGSTTTSPEGMTLMTLLGFDVNQEGDEEEDDEVIAVVRELSRFYVALFRFECPRWSVHDGGESAVTVFCCWIPPF
jgi:hypothetical protein